MKNSPTLHRTQSFIKCVILCALPALTAPLAVKAQQTIFYDTFGSSTLNGSNGVATGVVGGVPTASFTSYEIGSVKVATGTTNFAGHLQIVTAATSSGNTEAEALFTKFPVSLAAVGDYIELDYTFTDTTNIYNGGGGNNTGLYCGLFNSGGVPPLSGTILWNSGLSTSLTTADTGGTKNWVGYNAGMVFQLVGNISWNITSRPVQTAANNSNQQLLFGATGGSGHNNVAANGPILTVGTQYTTQYRITLSAPGTLIVSNAMYAGTSVGGTLINSNITSYTGANFLTTNFDGLAVGYRAGGGGIPWTNDINSITVIASLAAQAGPYFTVTASGNGCGGGNTIGLSGSVTTNQYLLYANNTYTGQSILGTGAPISFGFQTVPAVYTVIASNIVTASTGPMYGNANVAVGAPIVTPPASVTCVTNVPASFVVSASGNLLTYQWYKNGIALTNGGDISGAQTTNLVINPTQAADAATTANGYFVVVQDACGDVVTSTPNASLTLTAPNKLTWAGGNPDNSWDYTTANFKNPGNAFQTFSNGDSVVFNDTSGNSTVSLNTNLTATLVTVNASQSYNFTGAGGLTGFSSLLDMGSGNLVIGNNNTYTGGTIVSNGATLTIGTGSGTVGSVAGTVTVSNNATLNYSFAGSGSVNSPILLNNAFGGNGTINFNDANGSIIATFASGISSNFTGTINVEGFTALHASDVNSGFALGNGSIVNVPDNAQVWLDRSATSYNNTFNIGGNGWLGATPGTGAMRVFGSFINGPINLMDNARIGGTINGASIQSVISGNFQLEVWGTTNSFVLVMGPTNGAPQAYASTLITAGSILAATTNAISSGPLTLDVGGDLRVNGFNVTVANLSSINSGNIQPIEGARVRNMNTTNAGTLTVGTDGTSTEFDGTFSDGAAAPFGLIKVGAGTLTVTAVNTNTGTVAVNGGTLALSGSGSFGKAAVIAPSGSGTYDVTGVGGTLTLNSAQTLSGNGTVKGAVVAGAGTTVSPGLPMGTLTITGNATISGTYRANLNRTNSPVNCNQLTSSGGSITYSGATLVATNVGPQLHAGDFFQLFPGATAGFSTALLQTNDVPNNSLYTWNNTVASNGRITVATVSTLVNTNSTNIVTTVSGNSLILTWPADHTGWTLQAQTNAVSKGLSTNWVNVAGSASVNSVTNTLNRTNGAVFYRLVF